MALARVLCPTLIGRESELSALEDALLAALRGDGGVLNGYSKSPPPC
jgi:hypothetical protein